MDMATYIDSYWWHFAAFAQELSLSQHSGIFPGSFLTPDIAVQFNTMSKANIHIKHRWLLFMHPIPFDKVLVDVAAVDDLAPRRFFAVYIQTMCRSAPTANSFWCSFQKDPLTMELFEWAERNYKDVHRSYNHCVLWQSGERIENWLQDLYSTM